MKTKAILMVALMGISSVLMAQPVEKKSQRSSQGKEMRMDKGQHKPGDGLNLTDLQKESFKQGMMAMQKEMKPIRNALGEAMAHQRTLTSVEKPDLKAINQNLDKIGEMKTQMAKIQAKNRIEMRALLTDEQQMKFDMHKGKMMKDKMGKDKKHRPMRG